MALAVSQIDYPQAARPNIEDLAIRHRTQIIRSRADLEASQIRELFLSFLRDLSIGDQVLSVLVQHLKNRLTQAFKGIAFNEESDVLVVPGFAAPSEHLQDLVTSSGIKDAQFFYDGLPGRNRVLDDADHLANTMLTPKTAIANSRGALVVLDGLAMLQERGRDNLIEKAILIAPVSQGIRRETAALVKGAARTLNSKAIADLCPDSDAVKYWERLNEANRAKVSVVSQQGGDIWTSPHSSFVAGGTTYLTPQAGHQAVLDPRSGLFMFTSDLIKHSVAASH